MTYWLPLASAANVAQGAAALAVALKTRDKKLKSMALPASLSAFMGITEPAIFGVNMRFFRPFIAGSIGGACGALYASIVHLGATGTGVTGIFGILLHLHRPTQYIITIGIAAAVAFVLSWLFGLQNAPESRTSESAHTETTQAQVEQPKELSIGAPVEGVAVWLSETNDQTFADELLGKGIAIRPAVGQVTAPCDGTVNALMGHAVGLSCDNGAELLIHVGINTVELHGKYYTAHVQEGQHVHAGDALLTFDMQAIQDAGYPVITPVIVTNSDDFTQVETRTGAVKVGEPLLTLRRG